MSRSDPYKIKRRAAKETVLFCGEGSGEEVFLKHLRKLYSDENNIAVRIINGNGGNAPSIINRAIRFPGDYSKKIVVLDNDKSEEEMQEARQIAGDNNLVLLENSPCFEALLLSILNNGASHENQSSAKCKSLFQGKYIQRKARREIKEYEKWFPKSLLDSMRSRVSILDELIKPMEGSL